jgi:hypothetical protein
MCDDDCNSAYANFPVVLPRQLKLNGQLQYRVDASGNITVGVPAGTGSPPNQILKGPATFTVCGGEVVTTTSSTQKVEITLRLILPSSIGCSLIQYVAPPTLRGVVSNAIYPVNGFPIYNGDILNFTPSLDENVVTYIGTTNAPVNVGNHCLTSLTINDPVGGKIGTISLGCGCDRPDGCMRIQSPIFLVESRVVT